MVQGCFIKNNLSPLIKLEGRIIATVYVDVLENYLLPFIDFLDNQKNYFFQENNASIYTAKVVKS